MKSPAPSLLPILRSDAQGRVLTRLFVDPEQVFNLSELAASTGSSLPTVKREIDRAEAAGIVTTERAGPTRLVRANAEHPLFDALRRVLVATFGPPAVIASEFHALGGAEAVLLFGSWADRYLGGRGRAPRDVDVLVIGAVDRDAVDDAAERAERRLGMAVEATVRSRSQWEDLDDSFIGEVHRRPRVVVLATDEMQAALDEDRGAEEAM